MSIQLRIATFNLENFDDKPGQRPTLAERIALMRPQMFRLRADVICLQEVNGQESTGQPRRLLALDALLQNTPYASYSRVSTTTQANEVFDERNLVILSRFPIVEHHQYQNDFAPAPRYQKVTATPAETEAKPVIWERPVLYAKLQIDSNRSLHVINLHLKSKIPTNIAGRVSGDVWNSSSGWAEGFFISSMKRVGQALETRILIDSIFNADESAMITVCGDFNADTKDVPVEAIRGDVENTNNGDLSRRVIVPCEQTLPEPSRFSLKHHGQGVMLDHLLVSRNMLAFYKGAEVHNELLPDESIAFANDTKYPESDHAPVIAEFELPD